MKSNLVFLNVAVIRYFSLDFGKAESRKVLGICTCVCANETQKKQISSGSQSSGTYLATQSTQQRLAKFLLIYSPLNKGYGGSWCISYPRDVVKPKTLLRNIFCQGYAMVSCTSIHSSIQIAENVHLRVNTCHLL